MPTILTEKAIEQSTFAIVASFTDETGAALTPNAGLTWSLYKKVGQKPAVETVVNGRLNEAIASAASITIVLSGDDLALGEGGKTRYLLVEGTFDSDLGAGLSLKEQVIFEIANLIGVA